MYVAFVCAETDDVTSVRSVLMTTGDDVLTGEYDVIIVDFPRLYVIIAVLRLVVLLMLVTLVTGESVYVVIATPGDVIWGWTGFDDVETSCDDVRTCDVVSGNWLSTVDCAPVGLSSVLVTLLLLWLLLMAVLVVLRLVLVMAMSVVMAVLGLVTASDNELPLSDVTADVTNDDPMVDAVDTATGDVMSGTSAELTYSDVISVSRDVSTGVNTLTGDVITADDLGLLLTRVDVSCRGLLDVVMVTLLLGDVDNCTELVRSLLDWSVVSETDALILVTSLKYCVIDVTSALCSLLADTLPGVVAMATYDVTRDDVGDMLVLVVGRVVSVTCALLAESLVDKSTMAPVVAMTTCDVITCTLLLSVLLGWLLLCVAVNTSAVDVNSTCGLLASISSLVVFTVLTLSALILSRLADKEDDDCVIELIPSLVNWLVSLCTYVGLAADTSDCCPVDSSTCDCVLLTSMVPLLVVMASYDVIIGDAAELLTSLLSC